MRVSFLAICFLTLAPDAWCASSPWTVDALMAIETIHDPQITSDGSRVAFIVRSVDAANNRYQSSIRIIASSGGVAAPPADAHRTDSSPRWSPDGKQLAFMSRRSGAAQVYLLADTRSKARCLTTSATGIESFAWSPDGRSIAYIAQQPRPEDEQRRIKSGDDAIVAGKAHRNSGITIVSVADGKARPIASERHILSLDWSPDGRRLVVAAQKSARGFYRFHSDLYEIDLASGRESVLVEQPGQDQSPSYSRDGKWIAFYSQKGSLSFFGERHVGIVPSGGGQIRYVTEQFDGDVFNGARKFWWSPDGSRLWFGAGKGTANYVFAADLRAGTFERVKRVTDTSAFSASTDGSRVAYVQPSNSRPPELFVNSTRTVETNVDSHPQVTAETVRWKSADGMAVEGVLRLPFRRTEGTRVPLVAIIHGGPTGVAVEDFPIPRMYPTQLFLEAGFAVFEPNFRGSINYGPKFRLPLIEQLGRGDMDDVMAGIDMLIAKGIADPERLGIMGWSYGGYLTSWIVGHSNRFKAASIGGCDMDWVTHYGASVGGLDGPREVVQEYFGGKPWDRFEAYQKHSPRYWLKNVKTPSLLMRGEADQDTMAEMYLALTELGVPAEFVTYPREPHSIGEPMHQRDLLRRNLQWFADRLR